MIFPSLILHANHHNTRSKISINCSLQYFRINRHAIFFISIIYLLIMTPRAAHPPTHAAGFSLLHQVATVQFTINIFIVGVKG